MKREFQIVDSAVDKPPVPPERVNELAAQIKSAWQKSVESIIETGQLLIQAQQELAHGQWLPMVRDKLPFSDRTAQILMAIAKNPELSNPQHVAHLPAHWGTIGLMAGWPPNEIRYQIQVGNIKPEMTRADVERLPYVLVRQLPHAIDRWLRFAREHKYLPTGAKDVEGEHGPHDDFVLKELSRQFSDTNVETIRYHLLPWMSDVFEDVVSLRLLEDDARLRKHEEGIDRKARKAMELIRERVPECEKLLANTDVAIRVSSICRQRLDAGKIRILHD